jgi:hypothetical protein
VSLLIILLVPLLLTALSGCSATTSRGVDSEMATRAETTTAPEVRLSLVRADDDIVIQVTMTNRQESPFRLLKWNLPPDGTLTTALFAVSRNGKPVEYTGKMIKRTVMADDYMVLDSGRNYSTKVGLASAYDVKPKGRYIIQYVASNQTDSGKIIPITSNEIVVEK